MEHRALPHNNVTAFFAERRKGEIRRVSYNNIRKGRYSACLIRFFLMKRYYKMLKSRDIGYRGIFIRSYLKYPPALPSLLFNNCLYQSPRIVALNKRAVVESVPEL